MVWSLATEKTMRRREFNMLIGGALAAWPLAARSQEPGRVYRLGCLIPVARQAAVIVAFFDELGRYGFAEDHNLSVLPGGFEVRNEQISELAAALVKAAPDVILAGGDLAIRALQKETRTIPINGMTEDMVAAGLVASLARPGGNTTGISLLSPELDGKRQEILLEAVPSARRIAALADSTTTPAHHLQSLQDAARSRGISLAVLGVSGDEGIAPALNEARAAGAEAINVLSSPMLFLHRATILQCMAELRLPAIYQRPEMADEGALIAYGPPFTQLFRQRARMIVKTLRGTKPADIPVEQPTKFEFVINLKAAKQIGLTIPPNVLVRANKVIR
jgi:putative ABC transport system substrate-binding protein